MDAQESRVTPEVPSRRRSERNELISLFAAMLPGDEITHDELAMRIGLDMKRPGDRSLVDDVRRHCRRVLYFIVDAPPGKFHRCTDEEVDTKITPRRQERIYRQGQYAIEETLAVDPNALSPAAKERLFARQAIFGAVIASAHHSNTERVIAEHRRMTNPPLPSSDDSIIEAAAALRQ